MRTITREIAGAFIFSSDGYILLGKSKADSGVYQGYAMIPGGVDTSETKLQAVIREVREEVGMDIGNYDAELVNDTQYGESEKTLQSGERVYVKMHFNDFYVRIPKPAADTTLVASDDLESAEWVPLHDLPNQKLTEPMRITLHKLGYLE